MHPSLTKLMEWNLGQSDLSQTAKDILTRSIKEIDKAFFMLEFKLDRLEKDRRTLSVMLEESVEDLQKKSNAIEKTNKELTSTLYELKSAQAQLVYAEKMASLGELTAGIAHEIQNPLNFVNNFSEVNLELISELKQEAKKGNIGEIQSLANHLEGNEEKIIHHGKRADAIVKSMLQHSRNSSGQKEPIDLNLLVDEYLKLAYHGLHAKNKNFNSLLETNFDPTIGMVGMIPQDIGRVLLNIYNNAFYAVMEKKKLGMESYQPSVTVDTKKTRDGVEIRVKDNGIGIPDNLKEKIFQPFFTTKPTGEGTGLGLSLGYDIIKAHQGSINVTSREGEFTEFIIQLPG
jgi:two-component system NtrC family sensor kinase